MWEVLENPAVGEFVKRTLRKIPFSLEPVETRRDFTSWIGHDFNILKAFPP
jgi:hypothetical protein